MRLRPGVLYSALLSGRGVEAEIENPYLEVEVFPSWFDRATLAWKIPSDWGDCTFNVYRSLSDAGPFEKVNTSPLSGFIFDDTESRKFSKYHPDFYVVEAILHDKGGALLRSKPISWVRKQSRWVELRSLEIQRRLWLMLRKFMGVETLVLKRRTFGKRCSTCWDPINLKVTNDRCPECYGVGWSGGYLPAYPTLIQYDATVNNTEVSVTGRNEPSVLTGLTVSFPEIDDWDLIYRVKDRRAYRVDKVLNTELMTATVSQRMQLIELPKNYIEYRLAEKYLE